MKSSDIQYLICILLAFQFISCSKNEVQKEISQTKKSLAAIDVIENGGTLIVLNKSVIYNDYFTHAEVRIDGEKVAAKKLSDTLATRVYDINGSHYITVVFYNEYNRDETLFSKDTTVEIKSLTPVYKFLSNYQGKGHFQLINESKHIPTPIYYLSNFCSFSYIKTDTLNLTFERNGIYFLTTENSQPVSIEVNDLPEAEPFQQFEGNFIGEINPAPRNAYNDFYCSYGLIAVTHSPVMEYKTEKGGVLFINHKDFHPDPYGNTVNPSVKYNYLKGILKEGELSKNNWTLLFYTDNIYQSVNLVNNPDAKIEITKVEETPQIKCTPEMYEKSFRVTFKISADILGKGKIEGNLNAKYVVF